MLIDTHCHLDACEFDADRDALVAVARAAGVSAWLVPAVGLAGFGKVRDCCQRYPGVFPAYGFHPLQLGTATTQHLVRLRQWLQAESSGPHPPVAVGEIGLDFFVPGQDRLRQTYFFTEQLRLAETFALPVLLHVRRAVDQVLQCLRRSTVRCGIAHAFNGSRQQAQAFIDLGFHLGFGGAMTHPRATRIRQLAAELPLESIVLETDAPDMAPHWCHGQRNTPGELRAIAAVLAELRALPLETVLAVSAANARKIIKKSGRNTGFPPWEALSSCREGEKTP